ncbi:response regulator [Geofilum rhodophaeum]|uniref:response regulator n=1 Tax=Geofilum rhodophaeum TaxID=1965019 RepID=UPI000B5260E2|nr:response regulator [Geofilum rhodophaeum]
MDGLHLLLVEDNVLNQKLIFLSLTKYGFVIDIANNGAEAVQKVRETRYDLVLMDLMMPVMDGFEATVSIRSFEKEQNVHPTPIIGLTANTFDADREKCLAIGMDEYMAKPFDFTVFKAILENLGISKS